MDETTAADRFAALGHPSRLRIFRALVRAGRDGAPVGALQDVLDIPASTLTHHIQGLAKAGLVHQQRDGRILVTHADYEAMHGLIDYLNENCCQGMDEGSSTS